MDKSTLGFILNRLEIPVWFMFRWRIRLCNQPVKSLNGRAYDVGNIVLVTHFRRTFRILFFVVNTDGACVHSKLNPIFCLQEINISIRVVINGIHLVLGLDIFDRLLCAFR